MNDNLDIVIADEEDGSVVGRCTGPAPDGSCPRVAVGELVPCAGAALSAAGAVSGNPYNVPTSMTMCPVTLASMLAVSSDAPFGPGS